MDSLLRSLQKRPLSHEPLRLIRFLESHGIKLQLAVLLAQPTFTIGQTLAMSRAETSRASRSQSFIKAANSETSDQFGTTVVISSDTFIVGTPLEDSVGVTITNGETAAADKLRPDSGAVYVYQRVNAAWTQQAHIKAVNYGAVASGMTTSSLSSLISLSNAKLVRAAVRGFHGTRLKTI